MMHRFAVFIWFLLLVNTSFGEELKATSVLSETRATDYTIGDIAIQTLMIEVPKGYALDEGSVPERAKTEAIELSDIEWKVEQLADKTRYHFTIAWQIFVAFETVKSVPLRTLEFVFRKDGQSIQVTVPPDSVLVSSLLPPKMDAKYVQPYPNVAPSKVPLRNYWLGLLSAIVIGFFALGYIAWFMGWVKLPFEKNMPFRQAWRHIQSLAQDDTLSVPQALKLLSVAVSRFAGYVVTKENLTRLTQEKQSLAPYSPDLTRFYQDIQTSFFEGGKPVMSLKDIKSLAKQLSHLEIS